MADIGFRVTLRGRALTGDVRRTVADSIDQGLEETAERGARYVRDQLTPGHGDRTGHLKSSVWGGLTGAGHAQVDAGLERHGANVIYTRWVEGADPRNRARPGFPGYQMFERAAHRLQGMETRNRIGTVIVRRLQ